MAKGCEGLVVATPRLTPDTVKGLEDAGEIGPHAALGEEPGYIGIAQAEPEIPAHGRRDAVGREAVPGGGRPRAR